ncbi:hypothetical protein SAMN04487943_101648 [Gracilibacillus orientalis]|uniref:Uncharacterized protein n=1 Tax=Gracilibacillus orientalis TaxID=334253 RepID=A0A1I4HU17_9BACI|nr:hypothetical protein SAMN04487943_101648 [Gracilibacillus orientalis]
MFRFTQLLCAINRFGQLSSDYQPVKCYNFQSLYTYFLKIYPHQIGHELYSKHDKKDGDIYSNFFSFDWQFPDHDRMLLYYLVYLLQIKQIVLSLG